MHGRAAGEGGAGPSTAEPVVKNVVALSRNRELGNFVKEALTGKPQDTVDSVVRKLAQLGTVCIEDIQFLPKEFSTREKLTKWLEERLQLEPVTCMRLSHFLFETAHGPSRPQGPQRS